MKTIVSYINDNGDKLDLTYDYHTQYTSLTGIDGIDVEQTTSKGYRQDGTTLEYISVPERDMTLKFIVMGESHDDFMKTRDKVNKAFRPKMGGRLFYNDGVHDVYIDCHASKTPKIPMDKKISITSCTVELVANDPYFYDREEQIVDFSTWEKGFSLPLNPEDYDRQVHQWNGSTLEQTGTPNPNADAPGFMLRRRGAARKNIYNDGHVAVPFTCRFKGPATQPTIRSARTGEFLRMNTTLTASQTLVITTYFSDKSVKIEENGVMTDAYNKINELSTFFWLQIGDNPLWYANADSDQVVNEVMISYRRAYGGI